MQRRSFLRSTALTAAGSALLSSRLLANIPAPKGELLGLQLYSVRADMTANPLATLKAVADMGYKHVEHADYVDRKFYGYPAKEFRKVLDDLGLKMPSGHTVMNPRHWDEGKKDFTDAWKHTVEDAAVAGQQIVINPWLEDGIRKDYEGLLRYLEVFNKAGELCAKSGLRYGYHNHDFEFSMTLNGQQLYDVILEHTDPKLVVQQFDMGNLYNGGAQALDIMKKYPGRFLSMHVKDEILGSGDGQKYESAVLGTGIVPVKEVIDLGRKNGTKHFIIEQESYQGKQPLDSMKENLAIMKKWGY
jgi:sugar phosphate isomerase/epimerase